MEIRLEKMENKNNGEVFFRYRIGDFKFWFTQRVSDGDIFAVYVACDNKEYENFELYVVANEEDGRWYPNEFALRGNSSRMTTAEAEVYMKKMTEICKVLDAIQNFFKTSFHARVKDLKVKVDFGFGGGDDEYWACKIGDITFGYKCSVHTGDIFELKIFDDKNKYDFFEICAVCDEKGILGQPVEFFLKPRFPDLCDDSLETCNKEKTGPEFIVLLEAYNKENTELEFIMLKIKEFFKAGCPKGTGENTTKK